MRSVEDWGQWVQEVASTEPTGRRYRAFHEKLERLAPNWREHMRSADFVSWGSTPDTADETCMFNRLFRLYDDPAFGAASFAALLKLHPLARSEEDGQRRRSWIARGLKGARPELGSGAARPLVPVLHGRYEVLKFLGRGGNGEVYLVWSRETTSVYALKLIRADLVADPTVRRLFRRECETWIRLGDHPNIAKAHFYDEMGSDLLVTMELVQSADDSGPSLADKLESAGRLDERRTLGWFANVCDGLAHAYAHGVSAHRDIKPGNILIDSHSTARASDFGLAHSAFEWPGDHDAGAGTPHYASPEQSSAQPCDQRSDIYSLGVTMYQACSGRLPFMPPIARDADPLEVDVYLVALREMHCSAPLPRLNTPLWPVIQRCMAKRAQDRYATVNDLRQAIVEVAARMGVQIPAPPTAKTDVWTYPEQGNSLMRLGKYEEAIVAFDQFLRTFSTDGNVLLNRACCLGKLGRYDEAMTVYEPLARRDEIAGLVNGSDCLRRLGRLQEALSYALRAVELFPTDADAWLALGGIQFGLEEWPGAVDSYGRAHQLQPSEPTPLYNIAIAAARIPDDALTNKASAQFLKLATPDDQRRGSIENMLRKGAPRPS